MIISFSILREPLFENFFVISIMINFAINMNTFLLIMLATVVLVAICFVAIGLQVFFSKKKKFPETEIGRNAEMRKRNIRCAKCEELERCALKDIAECNADCGKA